MKNKLMSPRTMAGLTARLTFCTGLLFFTAGNARETNVVEAVRAALAKQRSLSAGQANAVSSQAQTDLRAEALAQWLRTNLPAIIPTNRVSISLSAQTAAIKQLRDRAGNDVEVHLRPTNGTVMQIEGKVLERAASGVTLAVVGSRDELTARNFLRTNRALIRIDDPNNELVLVDQDRDAMGNRHLRFSQTYHGLTVWPAGLSVHLDSRGDVYLMDGTYIATPSNVVTQPILTAPIATQKARDAVEYGWAAQAKAPQLIIYGPLDAAPRLAWKVELDVDLAHDWIVVIDALDGRVRLQVNQCMDENVAGSGTDLLGVTRPLNIWHQGGTYYMIDTSKPMFNPAFDPIQDPHGAIFIEDARNVDINQLQPYNVTSSVPNNWTVGDAVSAAYNFSQTFDYYSERFARNSVDGSGGNIGAIVRISNLANAFWRPDVKLMFFGNVDRYAASLDVIGHELTHGVTQFSAGLGHSVQPGALNEAFSDILGEMVEARTTGKPDWLIGSQLQNPVRDMRDPSSFGYPSKWSQFQNLPDTPAGDYGGVHANACIIDHAYYYLVEGLTGAIGIREAEQIFYQCLTRHLHQQSQFIDARIGCIASAEELFGAGSVQAIKTAEAFDSVEIFGAPAVPDPTRIPAVQAPDSTLVLYRGFFDTTDSLWRRETGLGDPAGGTKLISGVQRSRLSVSGDGSAAVYVTAGNDLGGIATDGSTNFLGGIPGVVHSVTISPDGRYWGFVLLDATGSPDNKITVIDRKPGGTNRTFTLVAPSIDGGTISDVIYADVLNITYDGTLLVYDALSEVKLANGTTNSAWSIYGIDLTTGTTKIIVPPIEGFDIGNPALSHTSTRYLTLDAQEQSTGKSIVITLDLVTGDFGAASPVLNAAGVPSFNGDDSAVVYTADDSGSFSGHSLYRQALLPDHLTTNGAPTLWLRDGWNGVIYRRGKYINTNAQPTVQISSPANGAAFTYPATVQIQAVATDSDGTLAKVEFYAGSQKVGEANAAPYNFTWSNPVPGSYRLFARAMDNLGGASDSSPVNVMVNQAVLLRLDTPTRLSGGQFRLNLVGSIGLTNFIEASTNLANWTVLTNVVNNNGTMQFTDPSATNFVRRFYRGRQQQ